MTWSVRMRCLRAFWEERRLPAGVLGPVDFWAFWRMAAIFRGLEWADIRCSFRWFVFGSFSRENGDCERGTRFFWFVFEKKRILLRRVLCSSAPIADSYADNARGDW